MSNRENKRRCASPEDNMNKKLEQIWTSSDSDTSDSEQRSLAISDSISNEPWFEEFMKDKEERDELREWRKTLINLIKVDLETHKNLIPPDYTDPGELNRMSLEELEALTLDLNKLITNITLNDLPEDPEAEASSGEDSDKSIYTIDSRDLDVWRI